MATPAPLEDDDLLREILLRLPPLPSTLSRASLVCTPWRRILSDPRFLSRLRRNHPKPPLLGFFKCNLVTYPVFHPVLDLPDRIPAQRFFVPEHRGNWVFLGCRHGLAVMLSNSLRQVFVWDPLNGHQHRVPFPPAIHDATRESFCLSSATVMHADDQDGHMHDDGFMSPSFKLVLVCTGRESKTSFACVYESASGEWGNIASTATTGLVIMLRPSILIGNALYLLLDEGEILGFDMGKQTLGVIRNPADSQDVDSTDCWTFQLLRTDDDSALGLAVMSKLSIHIWERKLNPDGVAGWLLPQKIILPEWLFPERMSSDVKKAVMLGYDEELNVLVLSTFIGHFMLDIDSRCFRLIVSKLNRWDNKIYFPYRNFFTAGRGVGWKWVDPKL